MIENELLSKYTKRKVYWHEIKMPMYVRCHFDQKRYLSYYQDIPILKINNFIEKEQKMKNLPKRIYLNIDEDERIGDFKELDYAFINWSIEPMEVESFKYNLAKPYLSLTKLISKMQEHKKNIGKEKCTYTEGVLFGYFLGMDTEFPSCGKCKYFEISDVDPNGHFGYCNMHEQNDDNDLQIVREDVTLTISDYCSRFNSK